MAMIAAHFTRSCYTEAYHRLIVYCIYIESYFSYIIISALKPPMPPIMADWNERACMSRHAKWPQPVWSIWWRCSNIREDDIADIYVRREDERAKRCWHVDVVSFTAAAGYLQSHASSLWALSKFLALIRQPPRSRPCSSCFKCHLLLALIFIAAHYTCLYAAITIKHAIPQMYAYFHSHHTRLIKPPPHHLCISDFDWENELIIREADFELLISLSRWLLS